MLPLFTSLESNCGVICSPLQKNPPKKNSWPLHNYFSAKHDVVLFLNIYCINILLLFSLEVNLVNTDNSFGQ